MPFVAFLPFFSTLAGGVAALRLRHRLHAFMALAAGVVVATAVADLLPEAHDLAGPGAGLSVGAGAVIGFLAFSLLEAFIHEASFEHAHGAEEISRSPRRADSPPTRLGVLPPASLILHSTLDGFAIGLGFQASASVGLVVLLAVLAHDFADGMNVVTLALEAARGERLAVGLLVLDALAPPVGAGLSQLVSISPVALALLLSWFAGVFVAVGAGHLLPEAQHRRPAEERRLVVVCAVGASIVLAVRFVGS